MLKQAHELEVEPRAQYMGRFFLRELKEMVDGVAAVEASREGIG